MGQNCGLFRFFQSNFSTKASCQPVPTVSKKVKLVFHPWFELFKSITAMLLKPRHTNLPEKTSEKF